VTPGEGAAPLDWGIGEYERTAAELEPVAERVVELAEITSGERVLDIACGTGNAALLAGAAGAVVSGLDSAPRLIEVAQGQAESRGLDAHFVVGDLEELPFGDGSFDAVLSIFGVIVASDADRAAAELVRVMASGGRGLVTAWIPEGAISTMGGVGMRAVQEATGAESGPRFAWSNRAAVAELFGRHDARVEFEDATVAFIGESAEAYFDRAQSEDPRHLLSREVLKRAGTYSAVRSAMIAALEEGNEDPNAFRVTSRYVIIRVSRDD